MTKIRYLIPFLALMLTLGVVSAYTPPTGAVAYVNLTLNESWSSVASPYVQQNITINQSNYTSYINYNLVENSTESVITNGSIANFEFTYANDTVIPSWIESNQSNQTLVWLNITNQTTSVYLDFFNMTTNTLNSTGTNGIGEAPQLSSTYAEYDDGASVFTDYWNWAGTSLPSGWTASGTTQSNGISGFSSGTNYLYQSTASVSAPLIVDALVSVGTPASADQSSFGIASAQNNGGNIGIYDAETDFTGLSFRVGTTTTQNQASFPVSNAVFSYYLTTSTSAGSVNYGTQASGTGTFTGTYYLSSDSQASAGDAVWSMQWTRTRAYPPNGIMPSVSFGAVQLPYTPPTVSVSPTSQTLDIPQSITLTATVSNGTTPYSYQWYNDTTGTPSAISGATSSTYTVVSGATGTFEYFVSVTDAHPTTVNSTNVIIIVNSALLANPITPSSPTIDNGQTITLTANPSGGTTSYSYQWYSGTSSTCSSDTAISGATSSTYPASPTSSTYYCYSVTDSATTPETNTSTTNFITVNPTLTATISPTTTNTYTYLTTTLTATASGGTPSYSYQWYNDTSGIPSAISGATSSTYNVAFSSAGTYVFFANVKDSSQGTPTASVNTSNATINVNLAFSELNYYFTNSSPLIYPAVPSFNITAIDQANDTITLNASLISSTGDEVFHDTSYVNDTNTTINSSNSTLTLGSLSAGTYTIYFNASDALGAYILNQTNFTIGKATPSLSLSVPSSYVYNNINQNIIGTTNVPYAANNSNLVSNLFLNGTQIDTLSQSSDSSSLTYIQTGTNLAVNTYTYVWNTTGNQNYTSASATGTFSITKASPILLFTVPANFTYNGNNGVINFGVNDINQQVLANLELNYSAYTLPAFDYDNIVANTTTNSTYGIPDAGIYNTTLYSQATQNYTANSTNVFWNITQAQGNAILQLNGTQANYTIYQHQTIPINASSTTSNNIQLFQNGTLISSQYNTTNPLTSSTIQTNNTATINFTADSYSQNYTNATQTWFLTVSPTPFQFNLTPTYNYLLSNGTLNSTSPQIFNLLNYSYILNGSSYWGISNITVSFNNSTNSNQLINEGNNTTFSNSIYNEFLNNSQNTYYLTINATDIYNDTNTTIIPINSTTYVFPIITPAQVTLDGNYYNYTWNVINTQFLINQSQGSFPISYINVTFGSGNSTFTTSATGSSQIATSFAYPSSFSGVAIVNTTAVDTNGYSYSTPANITVYNYTAPSTTLLTTQAFIHNQSYLFSINDGTFPVKYIEVFWGDGTETTVLNSSFVNSEAILYHTYTVAQTYELQVLAVDTENVQTNQTLTNPTLNVQSFTNPTVVSVLPNEPWNGANNNTETYYFTVQQGSYPIQNITIFWNDGYANVSPTENFFNITGSFGVIHTFPFLNSYTITTYICDQLQDCSTQQFPITLGFAIQNSTVAQNYANQTIYGQQLQALQRNPTTQVFGSPTSLIITTLLISAIAGIVVFSVISYNKKQKAKRNIFNS